MNKLLKIFLISLAIMPISTLSFAQVEEIIEEEVTVTTTRQARSAAPARGVATPTATSGARSARGVATPTATSGARSARGAAPAATTSGARSARGAAPAAATGAARSARGTTSAAGARSARGVATGTRTTAAGARSARTGRTVATTSEARSAVSRRAGVSNLTVKAATAGTAATTTTTSTTSVADALKAAGIDGTKTEVTKTKEQVAAQLADEKACREEYYTCMDTFCKDTAEDSIMGRCLCSGSMSGFNEKETKREGIVATINQLTAQTEYLPLAKKKADLEGKDFATALKEVTVEELSKQGLGVAQKDGFDLDSIDIYDLYLGEVSNKTVRKEGDALLKDANKNCATVLELCPTESRKRVESSYGTSVGNDCRAYSKEIDTKIKELTVVQQNAYNKYQMAASKYDLESSNKYNAEQCATELYNCMEKDSLCGKNFEKCYTDELMEARKINCSSVLAQCKGANMPAVASESLRTDAQTDVIWKAFKGNAIARAGRSNSQCLTDMASCMQNEAVCGEGYAQCYNQSTLNDRRKFCESSMERCTELKTQTQKDEFWATFTRLALSRSQLSGSECFKQSRSCVAEECGADFGKCLTAGTVAVKGEAKFLADVQNRAKTACGDIINKCASTYSGENADANTWASSPTEITNAIWDDIINSMINDNLTDVSDSEVYNGLTTCMDKICGSDYAECRNRTEIDSAKLSCVTQLNRSANPDAIWQTFSDSIIKKYGYTDAECMKKVEDYMKQNCGEGYVGCTTLTIDKLKFSATADAAEMCEWDVIEKQVEVGTYSRTKAPIYTIERTYPSSVSASTPKLDTVWLPIRNRIAKLGDTAAEAQCLAKGTDRYMFDTAKQNCGCRFSGVSLTGVETCLTKAEYDAEKAVPGSVAGIVLVEAVGSAEDSAANAAAAAADAAAAQAAEAARKIEANKTWCAEQGQVWSNNTCNFTVNSRGYKKKKLFGKNYESRSKVVTSSNTLTCDEATMGWPTNSYGCWWTNKAGSQTKVNEGATMAIPDLPNK